LSTLAIDNFKPSAGGTSFGIEGIAKAWVNFDGTGTVAIREAYNVASLTDNSTGNYTCDFTNNMGTSTYSTTANGGTSALHIAATNTSGTNTTSGFNIAFGDVSGSSATDDGFIDSHVIGDLA